MLPAIVLRVTEPPVPWTAVSAQLRPFVAQRVNAADVDDVVQDVFIRMQRGLPGLRDDQRFTAWLYQIARHAVADHGRTRARHPITAGDDGAVEPPVDDSPDDRATMRQLATCVAPFVAHLPSPYREAITWVELEGLTARQAAEKAGISLTAMKSRVRRARVHLRAALEQCCDFAVDARGKVVEMTPRCCPTPSTPS